VCSRSEVALRVNSDVQVVALVGIEGHNSSGCTWRIVVCELGKGVAGRTIVLLAFAVDSEVLFQSLISSFGLSITFGMIAQGKMKLHVKSKAKGLKEV